ncbi:MAG: hypothetical protein OIF55_20350 [Amphritea sp.]|nr:hypothetical protein [Amphritea sp.]
MASATQDIATDGYAVEHLNARNQSGGNAIQSGAVAAGVLIGGSGTLVLYEYAGWFWAVLSAGALSMLAVLLFLLTPEELGQRRSFVPGGAAVSTATAKPDLRQFVKRPGAFAIFAFALLFRLPEGLIKALEQSYSRG